MNDICESLRDTYEGTLGAERAEAVPLRSPGLLHEADLGLPVGRLSAGQRRRPTLALLVACPRPSCCCSTSPPTTSPPRCATNWRRRRAAGPARSSWPATTGG